MAENLLVCCATSRHLVAVHMGVGSFSNHIDSCLVTKPSSTLTKLSYEDSFGDNAGLSVTETPKEGWGSEGSIRKVFTV